MNPGKNEIRDQALQNNIKLYAEIFHIEQFLRKICYATYIAVYCVEWKRNIPENISQKIGLRRKAFRRYNYLTAESYTHPFWHITLFELQEILTSKNEVWSYFKGKTNIDKEIFIVKVGEIEYLRNIVSHGHIVEKGIFVHLESLLKYFNEIVGKFKANLGIVENSENSKIIYSPGTQSEKFDEKKEDQEEVFSYRLFKNISSQISEHVKTEIFESKDGLVVSLAWPVTKVLPDFDKLLSLVEGDTFLDYLIALSVSGDGSLIAESAIRFILNSKIKQDDKSQDSFIKYLCKNLDFKEGFYPKDPEKDLLERSLHWSNQEFYERSDELHEYFMEADEKINGFRAKCYYHPLVWDELTAGYAQGWGKELGMDKW